MDCVVCDDDRSERLAGVRWPRNDASSLGKANERRNQFADAVRVELAEPRTKWGGPGIQTVLHARRST